jgi:ATP-dependent Clp protease ATP-binding subunit ClpX
MEDVELIFTPEALSATAQQAEERKTGARGLRTAIEGVLTDVMFEIPSMDGVRKCIVDDNVILNRTRPLLMTERGDQVDTAA